MPISFGAGGKSTPKRKSRLPSTLPTNGLLVYLDAANPNSYPGAGSTWYDLSGNNLHATLYNGAAQNKNVAGGVMQFSSGNTGTPSTADYILTQVPNLSSTNYTVIAASRYTTLSGDQTSNRGRIVSGANNNWLMGHWNATQEAYYANGWVSAQNTSSAGTKWRIYAATGDIANDSYALYVNNTQTVSNNGGANGPNGIILGKAGSVSSASEEPSKGQISFLLVYNRVLTTQELTDVYNLFKDRFIVADSNLKLHIDAGDSASYSGSGTTVNDISGNGLNCTLTNGPTFSNGAFNLDATDDVILTNSTVDLRSDFTLEGWFSLNVDTTASFFGHGNAGAVNSQSLHTHFLPGSGPNGHRGHLFAFYYNDASSPTTNVNRPKNTWYHVVFTYSNSSPFTKKMYVNGVDLNLTAEQTQAAYAATPTVLRMGQSFSATGGGNCKIAQARYYNKVLTAAEVLQNYNATKNIFYPTDVPSTLSGLKVWFKADGRGACRDASDNIITTNNTPVAKWFDFSGNDNHAVQATTANMPAYRTAANGQNGLPGIYWDGTNKWLGKTSRLFTTAISYFIVVKFDDTNGRYWTFDAAGTYPYHFAMEQNTYNRPVVNRVGFYAGSNSFTSGTASSTSAQLFSITANTVPGATVNIGTDVVYRKNRESVTLSSTGINSSTWRNFADTSPTSASGFQIGRPTNIDAIQMKGQIFEIIVYDRVLTSTERDAVEHYLMAKWGIS